MYVFGLVVVVLSVCTMWMKSNEEITFQQIPCCHLDINISSLSMNACLTVLVYCWQMCKADWLTACLATGLPQKLLSHPFSKLCETCPSWLYLHKWVCISCMHSVHVLYRWAFQWQHLRCRVSFCLTQKLFFPSTELWSAAIYLCWAWLLLNGCKDSSQTMIHGLSHAHLGFSFSAPYHYKGFHIITEGKCSVAMRQRRAWITLTLLWYQNWNLLRVSCSSKPCCFGAGCAVFVCFPMIVHVFLWDCLVLVSLSFCSAILILEQWDHGCRSKNQ